MSRIMKLQFGNNNNNIREETERDMECEILSLSCIDFRKRSPLKDMATTLSKYHRCPDQDNDEDFRQLSLEVYDEPAP